MSMPTKILIAIPHRWLRDTVEQMLTGESAQIICIDTLEALAEFPAEEVDLLLIDIFNYKIPYTDVMKQVRAHMIGISVIAFMSNDTGDYRDALMRAGANMVVAKENIDKDLIPSLIQVLKGRECNEYVDYLLNCQNHFETLMKKEERYVSNNQDTTTKRTMLSRRTFLKGSAATAAFTGIAMSNPGEKILYALAENNPEEAAKAVGEELFNGVCRPNCGGACRMNVHVRDGRVVKTSMKPMPDPRYNRICLRGLSNVQRINNPKRIKYPMKRVGERGEDKWKRISWDEAIKTIVDNMNRISDKYGKQANSFISCSGSYATLSSPFSGTLTRLKNVMEATFISISLDTAYFSGMGRVIGGTLFVQGNEPADYANAKNVIVWAASITEAQIHNWHFIADAMDKGAKLIVIDPFYSPTAAKSDEWLSVRPGSDPALALAMMNVIIKEDLTDKDFMRDHTVAPFLVRADNKLFLRQSDLTGQEVAEGAEDQYLVWDNDSNQVLPVDQATDPAFEGTFEVNGVSVTTSFTLLKEAVDLFPPEEAAKITDIKPEVIRKLARMYADGPTTIVPGFGTDRYDNGQLHGHALAALASITGNIGKSGASAGLFIPYNPFTTIFNFLEFAMPDMKMGPTISVIKLGEIMKTGKFMDKPFPIKSLFVHVGNPVNTMAQQREWLDNIIPKMEFIAIADMEMNDTARYADIVLPVAHWFEQEDMIFTGNTTQLQWQDKAVEKAFESKTDSEIARLLAPGLGVDEYFKESDEEFLRLLLDSDACRALGITFDRLKKEKALRAMPGSPEDPFIYGKGGNFPTPSGRAEFYVEDPQPYVNFGQEFDPEGERLPTFRPPIEAWPENPLYEKYPLVTITTRERWRVHSQWAKTPWLRELDPEPTVKINPIDAKERGIKNGDIVEVYNDRGHVILKAVLSEAIRPGMLNVARGWEMDQHIAGSCQELTAYHFNPVTVNQSYYDVLAEVRKV